MKCDVCGNEAYLTFPIDGKNVCADCLCATETPVVGQHRQYGTRLIFQT